MPSVLNVDTLTDAAGTGPVTLTKQSAAKALLNFTSITTTSIRDSFNISSVTDVSAGRTQPISFTSNMNSADYYGSYYNNASATGDGYQNMNNDYAGGFGSKTTSSFGLQSYSTTMVDCHVNDAIIHGDLA